MKKHFFPIMCTLMLSALFLVTVGCSGNSNDQAGKQEQGLHLLSLKVKVIEMVEDEDISKYNLQILWIYLHHNYLTPLTSWKFSFLNHQYLEIRNDYTRSKLDEKGNGIADFNKFG